MSGGMMPKRGHPEFLARISQDTLGILGSATDYKFVMVSWPYTGLD